MFTWAAVRSSAPHVLAARPGKLCSPVTRFAPDFDDTPTLEIPDFRLRAQRILHMMIGADISAEEYLEKLELIQTAMREVYQEAVALTSAQQQYHFAQLERQARRSTRRPTKTEPGIGMPKIPPAAAVPLELDWDWDTDDKDRE